MPARSVRAAAGIRAVMPAAAFASLILLAGCASRPVLSAGNVENGRRVTEKWCVSCHAVAGARNPSAPSFAEIVRRPRRDDAYLRQFLEDDHFPMTMYRLFDHEKEDVLAYLRALKQGGP